MKGVILAAGMGSRLRPITDERPKPCVTVAGEPILARQLRAYADAGLSEVFVVAGYRADDVRALCRRVAAEYDDFRVSVVENDRYGETENMYTLSLVRRAVEGEPFVLSNGDVVFDPAVADHLLRAAGSAIACDTSRFSGEAMKITLDDRERVEHISKEVDREEAHAVSADVYRFSAGFSAQLFEEIDRMLAAESAAGWTEAAIDAVLARGDHDVDPLDVAGLPWVEVDDLADLLAADRAFSSLRSLDDKRAVFFDLDGTLYLGDDLVPGADRVVERLRNEGVEVFFLSNNSSGWKDDYAAKLDRLGVPATPEDVVLSTDGVIAYLRETGAEPVHVVGTRAMRGAIERSGVAVDTEDPEAVVVGFDTELTYEKVRTATLAIRDGAEFLLAHPDTVCPTPEGLVPDCGSIGALVETATERPPSRVFGKPNPAMLDPVLSAHDLSPDEIAVVGDRLETEVRMANRLGCDSVCVLTGDADRAAVEASEDRPSLVVESVADLASLA